MLTARFDVPPGTGSSLSTHVKIDKARTSTRSSRRTRKFYIASRKSRSRSAVAAADAAPELDDGVRNGRSDEIRAAVVGDATEVKVLMNHEM